MITPHDLDTLRIHTRVPQTLLDQIKKSIDLEKTKSNTNKRVKINLSPKNIELIIECIAEKINEKNGPDDVQHMLDNLFGRFIEEYNNYVRSTN